MTLARFINAVLWMVTRLCKALFTLIRIIRFTLFRDLIHPATEGQLNRFWRLARGAADTNYLLASEHSLTQIDIRV